MDNSPTKHLRLCSHKTVLHVSPVEVALSYVVSYGTTLASFVLVFLHLWWNPAMGDDWIANKDKT